ncbi:RidA family protein [Pseudonocardia hydrocarbonoxydans]|uniref:Enamine deaminase RidA n=1 Tax=Pseudonocardia hydrocarbonoxydans TaxID=76726 RepID=A0A4Y3WQI1_9PSEU|nr:Rid family hydrolase [Pseudonocardia hydrocarbonoxydans]GEC21123.1 enamine deaminase RidA [Pseudonocardia hydrocarbonoxydans]
MTTRLISPPGMLQQTPYHHVAVSTGTTHVHVAGQVGQRGDEPVAADDLAAQVAQALRNTAIGLAGAGASFSDVVRLTFYVTRWTPDKIETFMAGVQAVAEDIGLPAPMPPASLIGVEVLFDPDVLVEVEATAVLP